MVVRGAPMLVLGCILVCATLVRGSPSGSHQMYKDGKSPEESPFFNYEDEPYFNIDEAEFVYQPHIEWSHGDLRLVTGDEIAVTTGAGRLEVFMGRQYTTRGGSVKNGGYWGTVCGEGFTLMAASVACRQLGFKSASSWNYTVNTPFGAANESVPIVLEEVECAASHYWHLMRCNILLGDSESYCSHLKDVAVFCSSEKIWDDPYSGQVRLQGLWNSTIRSYGRVEVFDHGQWGTVCNKEFDEAGADSVCRQLGYTGAVYNGDALPGSGFVYVKKLTCESSMACFTDCFQHHVHIHDCNHTMDVAVQCSFDLSKASEYPAGYEGSCSINNFPIAMLILCVMLGLGTVILLGCTLIFIITITRCCYKCCRRRKRYEELY